MIRDYHLWFMMRDPDGNTIKCNTNRKIFKYMTYDTNNYIWMDEDEWLPIKTSYKIWWHIFDWWWDMLDPVGYNDKITINQSLWWLIITHEDMTTWDNKWWQLMTEYIMTNYD